METILELRGLTKRFGNLTAVNDLSLTMRKRSIHALIGPNGSGKTTTVGMINGTLPYSVGNVMFDGEDITGMKNHTIARKGVGRTFQNIKLFATMTVLENIMVGGHTLNPRSTNIVQYLFRVNNSLREETVLKEKAEAVLEFIGLKEYANREVGSLAYGLRKITEFGRALMGEPKLILLDEPAAGLNPSERVALIDTFIKAYERGTDFFLIEHNMDVVMNISTVITVLNFGTKIAEGTPKEIQTNPEVISAYLGRRYLKEVAR
ncbi:MAG: ABC transporter ATP-binding protein [Clostridiales Family XIII bacterium]|nr:ABC transporter ATP-binding protein [Clostridiales Family XIII bacterium]